MKLNLEKQLFIVGGASSGFGKAIATALLNEGAHVIAVARGRQKLESLRAGFPGQVEILAADITNPDAVHAIKGLIGGRQIHGLVVNAGGPPAMTVMETKMSDWDDAYQSLLRWKVELVTSLVPDMVAKKYGRIVFVESAAVKEPMENLVLSNSLRLAVIGFMKTFSNEIAKEGVTLNTLAPGFHATAAIDRLIHKKSEQTGMNEEEIRLQYKKSTKVDAMGDPNDFASLACWLLSSSSKFVTGQTISVDGGFVKGSMG